MIYQVTAIVILVSFYTFYFAKYIILSKKSIKTNQMGMGNKPHKVKMIERIMSVATISVFVGFDLLYLSICLIFFNVPLLILSV